MLSLSLGRLVAVSPTINRYGSYSLHGSTSRFNHKSSFRLRSMASESDPSSFAESINSESAETNPSGYSLSLSLSIFLKFFYSLVSDVHSH